MRWRAWLLGVLVVVAAATALSTRHLRRPGRAPWRDRRAVRAALARAGATGQSDGPDAERAAIRDALRLALGLRFPNTRGLTTEKLRTGGEARPGVAAVAELLADLDRTRFAPSGNGAPGSRVPDRRRIRQAIRALELG